MNGWIKIFKYGGLLALSGLLWGCPTPEAPIVASIQKSQGSVSLKTNQNAEPRPAHFGSGLIEGSLVITGPDGVAEVDFKGGNRVELLPNTTLLIRRSGGTTAQFGAILVTGSARASSGGQGITLAIGTPFGLTELGASESSMELSTQQGLKVLVGEVSILTNDGQQQTVLAGNSFTVDGLIVKLGGEEVAPIVLRPMKFVLLGNTKNVQIKRAGENKWRTARKKEVLAAGDTLRTRKTGNTQIQFEDQAGVTMGSATEMTIEDAVRSDSTNKARYSLAAGDLQVNLQQDNKVKINHEVTVGGLAVNVEPGLKEASVEIKSSGSDRGQIKVRSGRAQLPDGTVVEAGSTVRLAAGKAAGAVMPLAATEINLRPQSSAIVYFATTPPPIAFSWKDDPAAKDGYVFEVATDKQFEKSVVRERLTKNSFVSDNLTSGRYYWRVKHGDDWLRGSLSVQKRTDASAKIERHNFVDDTGEVTVVYYQKALPAITLRWNVVEGATSYLVKVYPDGAFDTPLASKTVTENKAAFDEGSFEEGKYYWHHTALNAAGAEIKTGRMNTLQIAYDNAVVDLSIKSPRPDQKVTTPTVTALGETQLGTKLSINERRADLDNKGRFREVIKLNKGENILVFKTQSADGVERYYTRSVYRR